MNIKTCIFIVAMIILIYVILNSSYGYGYEYKKYKQPHSCNKPYNFNIDHDDGDNTLNDMENNIPLKRSPIIDDTHRISNQMLWLSDLSQPGQGNCNASSLNDEIITPMRTVSTVDELKSISKIHHISRFGCEKS